MNREQLVLFEQESESLYSIHAVIVLLCRR